VPRLLDSAGRSSLICALSASGGRDGERACDFLLDALHCAGANTDLAGDLEKALPGAQLNLDALFDSVLPASTARLRPALTLGVEG
jgi:hypothetical protein